MDTPDVLTWRDAPDAPLARRALANAGLTVVVDTSLHGDVAPFADVVLPASVAVVIVAASAVVGGKLLLRGPKPPDEPPAQAKDVAGSDKEKPRKKLPPDPVHDILLAGVKNAKLRTDLSR